MATPQIIMNVIGWVRKYKRAARAARTLQQSCVVLLQNSNA